MRPVVLAEEGDRSVDPGAMDGRSRNSLYRCEGLEPLDCPESIDGVIDAGQRLKAQDVCSSGGQIVVRRSTRFGQRPKGIADIEDEDLGPRVPTKLGRGETK